MIHIITLKKILNSFSMHQDLSVRIYICALLLLSKIEEYLTLDITI